MSTFSDKLAVLLKNYNININSTNKKNETIQKSKQIDKIKTFDKNKNKDKQDNIRIFYIFGEKHFHFYFSKFEK